ncbi:MAG: transglycosylase SLT domain-containing protein [Alistipes sp.]|nr:transglycosylase SLT domain-containing protein [Alistipes sp.]
MRQLTKYLLLLVIIVSFATPSAYATDSIKRPRRKTEKLYTSPEELKQREDSTTLATDSINLANNSDTLVEIERANTLPQIDSVLAMWRATSTTEQYERYFNEYVYACENIDAMQAQDNMDSVYVERLNALMSSIPLEYNRDVRTAIKRYTSQDFATIMGYAYYYFPMFEEELILAGMPVELRALAIVESGLNPLATSRVGAKGLWQFMPSTGKEYGLEINSLVDERCNPRLATRAACRYLKNMYDMYGDWTLAIASYNCGPGNVNKAIIRAGGDPKRYTGSFWDVYAGLPRETRSYVPLFMGATYAFAYHRAHGIELPTPPLPLAVDTVMITRPLHLEQVSSTIDISLELLQMLNPEYQLSIIPATTKAYPLTLPTERISEFVINQDSIFAKDSIYLGEYIIHANLEKKRNEAPPATYHVVKKGDTLGGIAKKYGRTVKQLMTWNGLKNANSLRIGQKIRVSPH